MEIDQLIADDLKMSLANSAVQEITAPDTSSRPGALVGARWTGCLPQKAANLGGAFARGELTAPERAVAIEVFERLLRDSEVEVRRTLAEHIKSSPLLPRGLALQLAEDVAAVAVPILQSSPVLSDEDLVAIISGGDPAKQRAVAGLRLGGGLPAATPASGA